MSDVPTSIIRPTIVGWLARGTSLLLLLMLLIPVLQKSLTHERPIAFAVTRLPERTAKVGTQWHVAVKIENTGTRAARDVDLTLSVGSQEIDIHIDLIGASEERTYILTSGTRDAPITWRLIKFEAP